MCMTKARLKQEDLNLFDWELTDIDQGIFDTKNDGILVVQRGGHSHDTQEGVERYPTWPDQ